MESRARINMANAFKLGDDVWDPSHRLQTSWLLSPYVLAGCRALFAAYAFFVSFFKLGWQCTHPDPPQHGEVPLSYCQETKRSFSYFTVLTYWGIAFYMLFASIHGFTYARHKAPLLERWPRSLKALHSFLYTTIVTYPLLVTIVYWGLLFPAVGSFRSTFSLWSNISQHALNSFFCLFEIVLPRTNPPPLVHLFWLCVLLALYLALAYTSYATQGFFTYDFLDPGKQHAMVAAYVFGILVVIVILFGVTWSLIWVRRWLTEEKLGMKGKPARDAALPNDHEMGSRNGLIRDLAAKEEGAPRTT